MLTVIKPKLQRYRGACLLNDMNLLFFNGYETIEKVIDDRSLTKLMRTERLFYRMQHEKRKLEAELDTRC